MKRESGQIPRLMFIEKPVMQRRFRGSSAAVMGLLCLVGCTYPVCEETDLAVCDLVRQPVDAISPGAGAPAAGVKEAGHDPAETEELQVPAPSPVQPLAVTGRPTLLQQLTYPPGLPGSNAPVIQLPPVPDIRAPDYKEKRALRDAAIERLYPALPPILVLPQPLPGPEGRALTLADLQKIGLSNSPLVRQAASDVSAARGAALQAGAYPNPNLGYEEDTAGTGGTAGYQGFFVEQTIRTAGKVKLTQAAAVMDLRNSELALRTAKADLIASVRSAYFSVLIARETMRVNELLTEFSDRAYRLQVSLVRAGSAAAYEPMQLRVLAFQSRVALLQARNAYTAAWKQLASTLGRPDLKPTQLAGRIDRMVVPEFVFDKVLAQVLANHTSVQTAAIGIRKARYNLLLAQVTPVPDVNLHVALQKDFTTPPYSLVTTVTVGGTIPVWDLNRGNILQMQGALTRALEEPHRVRDDLTNQVADAFNRYQTNVRSLEFFRDRILPDQVRAYQELRVRYNITRGDVAFGDIITAQQTLGSLIGNYLTFLGAEWTAAVDLAHLLQTDELFTQLEAPGPAHACLTDLENELALPCAHPCNPLPTATPNFVDSSWPTPVPAQSPAPTNPTLPPPRKLSPAKIGFEG